MVRDMLVDLERLVDRLIDERDQLQAGNAELTAQRERLLADRERIQAELDKVLAKLDALAEGGR